MFSEGEKSSENSSKLFESGSESAVRTVSNTSHLRGGFIKLVFVQGKVREEGAR